MKHLKCTCAASIACLLLPSCEIYSLSTNTGHYVDAALSGGEARNAHYSVHAWSLSSSEIIELQNGKGDTVYMLPITMSTNVELRPLISYDEFVFDGPRSRWDTGTMELSEPTDPKKLYVPLKLVRQSRAAQKLRQYGIHRKGLDYTGDPDIKSYLQKGARLPAGWQMRRIAIPRLEQIIRHDLELDGRYYNAGRTFTLARAAQVGTVVCVDLPLSIVGLVLASLYESTLGHAL